MKKKAAISATVALALWMLAAPAYAVSIVLSGSLTSGDDYTFALEIDNGDLELHPDGSFALRDGAGALSLSLLVEGAEVFDQSNAGVSAFQFTPSDDFSLSAGGFAGCGVGDEVRGNVDFLLSFSTRFGVDRTVSLIENPAFRQTRFNDPDQTQLLGAPMAVPVPAALGLLLSALAALGLARFREKAGALQGGTLANA